MKPTILLYRPRLPVVVSLLWEPRDIWIGLYWNTVDAEYGMKRLDLYFCFIPMLPIRLCIYWRPTK